MDRLKIYSDKQLLYSIKKGSKDAFTLLFLRYSSQVYHVALKYTTDANDAEDIVQEVFSRIWIHRKNLREKLPVIPYLVKIGKNLIFNQAKKKLHQIAFQKYTISTKNFDSFETLETVFIDELEHLIRTEVEQFPAKRKEVYKLSREKGLTTKEIANSMNISTSTVENHLNKALKILRRRLEDSCYST